MRSLHFIFALSVEKLYQITKYKSEVLAPKSDMKQFFNPTFEIKKKKKVWVITRFGGCPFWGERNFRFQRNKWCFTGSWKSKENN